MSPSSLALLFLVLAFSSVVRAQYTPDNAPDKTEDGQTGTNKCGTESSQDSMCQNAYLNSVTDFCLWAPPTDHSDYGSSAVGNTERIMVAWCVQGGHGTRVIPSGAVSGAHFVKTPNYVQITGVGDFTKMNIPAGDDGGELDPHGADGNGNPIGGLVFSTAFGNGIQQVHEWTNFMSSNAFSFRGCMGDGAADYCQHIYDVMGSGWNAPGDYSSGSFDNCAGESAEKPGVYSGSSGLFTFHQGDASTPAAHPAGATSQCSSFSTIGNGMNAGAAVPTGNAIAAISASASSAVASGSGAVSSAAPSSSPSSVVASSSASQASSSASVASSQATSSTRASSVSASMRSSTTFAASRSSSASRAAASASQTGSAGRSVGAVGAVVLGVAGLVGGLMV